MIKPAVLGVGYWGHNLFRNVNELPDAHLTGICDLSPIAQGHIREKFIVLSIFIDFKPMMKKDRSDAILIGTPAHTHFPLVKKDLHHHLHVFVEKSLAIISRQARELIILADDSNLSLINWHTFLYSNYLREVGKYIEAQYLGDEWLCDIKHKKQISKIKNEVYYD